MFVEIAVLVAKLDLQRGNFFHFFSFSLFDPPDPIFLFFSPYSSYKGRQRTVFGSIKTRECVVDFFKLSFSIYYFSSLKISLKCPFKVDSIGRFLL